MEEKNPVKILLVDDDIALREVLKTMLADFTVVEADNGKDAVELYKTVKPDIVLMDIVMPEKNGIDATREILELDPNAKILAITAYAKSKAKEMMDAGAKEVISKPIKKSELVQLIMQYVNN
ncbi:response regulator [Archaeoglobales archaeon]|nr:MAG: response regulator [Archaeoglobales archaeon]